MEQRGDTPAKQPDGLLHPEEARRLLAAAAADASAPRCEFHFAPPAALHKPLAALLEDPRDLPILFLYLNVLLTTAPAAAALFAAFPPATRPLPHWLGAAYLLANYVLYLARFMLSLHYSQHRRLFRQGRWWGPEHGGLEWVARGAGMRGAAVPPPPAAFRLCLRTCLQACGHSTWWPPCCWRRCLGCPQVRACNYCPAAWRSAAAWLQGACNVAPATCLPLQACTTCIIA